MSWTPERTADLIARWKSGRSGAQIGRALGISRGAVIGKLNRLGLLKTRQRDQSLKGPRWDQPAQRPITLAKSADGL